MKLKALVYALIGEGQKAWEKPVLVQGDPLKFLEVKSVETRDVNGQKTVVIVV